MVDWVVEMPDMLLARWGVSDMKEFDMNGGVKTYLGERLIPTC